MILFNWKTLSDDTDWVSRFNWGRDEIIGNDRQETPIIFGLYEWNEQGRGDTWRAPQLPAINFNNTELTRPRLFISHKQEDYDKALRIAWLANQEGFDCWLDIFDPALQQFQQLINTKVLTKQQEALGIASIIEMGLINCSHLIAVMTPKAKRSQWVPYEYGRVKETRVITSKVGCWVARTAQKNLPEYLHLGELMYCECGIEHWLHKEMQKWYKERGSAPPSVPAGNWRSPAPEPFSICGLERTKVQIKYST